MEDVRIVSWPKTVVAWLATSALMFVMGFFLAPPWVSFEDHVGIFFLAMVWVAATLVMIVSRYVLDKLQCTKLRHFVLIYALMCSVILFDQLLYAGRSGFFSMFSIVLSLAPAVIVFWWFCVVLSQDVGAISSAGSLKRGEIARARGSRLMFAVAIGVAFIGVLALNELAMSVAGPLIAEQTSPLLVGQTGHPSLLWSGTLTAFVVAYWGTVVHFAVMGGEQANLKGYTLGFLVFVFAYSLFDVVTVIAAFVIAVWPESYVLPPARPWTFWDGVSMTVAYAIFPTIVVAGGPLLWWIYHRALPRVWPESTPGE